MFFSYHKHPLFGLELKVGESDKETNLIATYHLFLYLPRIMRSALQ